MDHKVIQQLLVDLIDHKICYFTASFRIIKIMEDFKEQLKKEIVQELLECCKE